MFLQFDEAFWDMSTDYIGYASSTHGEFYLFVNLAPVTGTAVLMSLVSGAFARGLELKSDDEIIEQAMNVLRKIYEYSSTNTTTVDTSHKRKSIPDPIDYIITRWAADEFSRGSYSYIAVGANGQHYDQLSNPVKNRLFWAGEATIRVCLLLFLYFLYKNNSIFLFVTKLLINTNIKKWPASVHGAYLSGLREARRIIETHYQPDCNSSESDDETDDEQNENQILSEIGLNCNPNKNIYKPIKDIKLQFNKRGNNTTINSSSTISPSSLLSKKKAFHELLFKNMNNKLLNKKRTSEIKAHKNKRQLKYKLRSQSRITVNMSEDIIASANEESSADGDSDLRS